MLEVIKGIEAQIKTLEDRFKKNGDYAVQIGATIEKLASDKVASIKDSDVVSGAIQAYQLVVAEIKRKLGIVENVVNDSVTVAEDVAKVVNDVEGN